MIYNITDFECVAYRRRGFLAPNFPSVQEKPVFCTECLRKRVAYTRRPSPVPRVHSVHQKALSCTEFCKTPGKRSPLQMQVLHGRNVGAVRLECRCHASKMQIPHERLRTLRAVQNTSAGNKTTAQRSSAPCNAHQPLPETPQKPTRQPQYPQRQPQRPVRDKMSLFVFWQMF